MARTKKKTVDTKKADDEAAKLEAEADSECPSQAHSIDRTAVQTISPVAEHSW